MNMIINLKGKFMVIIDIKTKETIALIEYDLRLVRYLLSVINEYEASNSNNYIQFENKPGETYLHRIIIEYYSQFDEELLKLFKNTSLYEVNHKNKFVWDNRLENLEIVTKLGNKKHEKNKEYEEEIVYSTDKLLELKDNVSKSKQDYSTKKYLEKVSCRNKKYLNSGKLYCNKEFYSNLYIRFSNKTIQIHQISINTISTNILKYFNSIIFYNSQNTFFKYNTTLDIYYNNYRSINIIQNNMKLILKYYNKNKEFRILCKKNKLLNLEEYEKLSNKKLSPKEEQSIYNSNILIDLYCYILPKIQEKTFYKNSLCTTLSINALILTQKKYKSFRILYLLDLLKRQPTYYYKNKPIPLTKKYKPSFKQEVHLPSSFFIPKYDDELFTTTILSKSKTLVEMDLSKITFTILLKNFNIDVARKVYGKSPSKFKLQRDLKTIEDIKLILLTSSTLKEKIKKDGFFSTNDLRKELQLLNQQRKERGCPYDEIKDSDVKFIVGVVKNILEIREVLDKCNLKFVRLNPNTIKKIRNYQKEKGEDYIPLVQNQTKIVLKDLIVAPKNKKTL